MALAYHITNSKANFSYIIPKAFTYSSNYAKIRSDLLENIEIIVDCGKVWVNVKLEVCIFCAEKFNLKNEYSSLKVVDGNFLDLGIIDKKLVNNFDFLVNGISKDEINVGLKLNRFEKKLNDFVENKRGAILQKYLSKNDLIPVIGGGDINKYSVKSIKGYMNEKHLKDEKAFIKTNSILVQRLVAHITKPYDYIKITALIPNDKKFKIVDTINQLQIKNNNLSKEFMWSLLNSKLLNWYVYRFVFCKAIRTMQFDNPTTSKIPIVKPNYNKENDFKLLTNQILNAKAEDPAADTQALEDQIDVLVYQLYGLTYAEVRTVDPDFEMSEVAYGKV